MTTAETNVIICSPGLIRMSDETMRTHVWTTLRGILHAPPRVKQRKIEKGHLASATFVIVELGANDRDADEELLVMRLRKLLCPTKLCPDDRDVCVALV